MGKTRLSFRIQFTLLSLILLLLPVYGYACVLPMVGMSGDSHAPVCRIIDCNLNSSKQTAQKYCETLQKMEAQHESALQGTLVSLEMVQAPTISEVPTPILDPPSWIPPHGVNPFKFSSTQPLYILHHILLL